MRRSGRINVLAIFGVIAVVMVIIVLVFSKQSLSNAGGQFMDALVRGDVDKLTDMSVVGNETPAQIHKQWEFATQVAGRNYSFAWKIISELQTDDKNGSVSLEVERNFGTPAAYPEHYALPMVKVNDVWKVDVANVSRELYPALPRQNAS
jgi:hypothetical protein